MSITTRATSLCLALACLASAAPAFADIPAPHSVDRSFIAGYLAAGGGAKPATQGVAVADSMPASAATAMIGQRDAGQVATNSAAAVGTCDSYFTQSQAMSPDISLALGAMNSHDKSKMAAVLPAVQAQLNKVPAVEIKPEVCNGNHINAYSNYQFFDLSVQRAHGVDTGLPPSLPLIKQPELNQAALAYIVGWIKYEQSDFAGAMAAYNKGLILFPHDHALQQEYLATLVQVQDGAGLVNYADKIIDGTYDLDDALRAKTFTGRAIGLIFQGRLQEADESLTVSLRYQYADDIASMQTELRKTIATQK